MKAQINDPATHHALIESYIQERVNAAEHIANELTEEREAAASAAERNRLESSGFSSAVETTRCLVDDASNAWKEACAEEQTLVMRLEASDDPCADDMDLYTMAHQRAADAFLKKIRATREASAARHAASEATQKLNESRKRHCSCIDAVHSAQTKLRRLHEAATLLSPTELTEGQFSFSVGVLEAGQSTAVADSAT